MKFFSTSVLLLAVVAITTQDITERKGCDCSICKGVDNKLNPIVGKRVDDDGGGKSSCSICEKRKEMLRMEREKQRQRQKCPFEILGSPAVKGKTSEEIFDEFRELVVPSQNGFFDMMRGVVRTMHVSSEAELKWAKEKEAKELAKKRRELAEAAKKRRENPFIKSPKEEIVGLNNPVNPKVTVVLKQTPCGQIIQPNEPAQPEKIPLLKRLTKGAARFLEDEVPHLQPMEQQSEVAPNENLHSDLIDELLSYKTMSTSPPSQQCYESTTEGENLPRDENLSESTTESPFVKFMTNDEMKALLGGKNSLEELDMGWNMLPMNLKVESDKENRLSADYSITPFSLQTI